MTRIQKRYGLVRNLLSHISRYLAVRPMFMFQRKKKSKIDKKEFGCEAYVHVTLDDMQDVALEVESNILATKNLKGRGERRKKKEKPPHQVLILILRR
jgi:hypothetical protein